MSILSINGSPIPDPSKLEMTISDISSGNSGRNAAGDLLKDKIAQKVSLSCSWSWLTNVQCSQLLNAVDPIYFSVTYPDPKEGTTLTKTMYVGDRTAPVYWVQNGVPGWQGVAMDLIEK
jgi:hypothetical protein